MLGTNLKQKNNIFIKNCIDFCEYYIHFFYKYFYCFAQLHTLSLRFENYFFMSFHSKYHFIFKNPQLRATVILFPDSFPTFKKVGKESLF